MKRYVALATFACASRSIAADRVHVLHLTLTQTSPGCDLIIQLASLADTSPEHVHLGNFDQGEATFDPSSLSGVSTYCSQTPPPLSPPYPPTPPPPPAPLFPCEDTSNIARPLVHASPAGKVEFYIEFYSTCENASPTGSNRPIDEFTFSRNNPDYDPADPQSQSVVKINGCSLWFWNLGALIPATAQCCRCSGGVVYAPPPSLPPPSSPPSPPPTAPPSPPPSPNPRQPPSPPPPRSPPVAPPHLPPTRPPPPWTPPPSPSPPPPYAQVCAERLCGSAARRRAIRALVQLQTVRVSIVVPANRVKRAVATLSRALDPALNPVAPQLAPNSSVQQATYIAALPAPPPPFVTPPPLSPPAPPPRPISGCTSAKALNFAPLAVLDDGSCAIGGCIDSANRRFDANATFDDGSCDPAVFGCTQPDADNFRATANVDDGSCVRSSCVEPLKRDEARSKSQSIKICARWLGACTDSRADNFDTRATVNVSCIFVGCMKSGSPNYNPLAQFDDGSCAGSSGASGCMVPSAVNYVASATRGASTCKYNLAGCTDSAALTYAPEATVHDSAYCVYGNLGCTHSSASNFNGSADFDDGSCHFSRAGCTDSAALNFAPDADIDDGQCQAARTGCMWSFAANYDPNATVQGVCVLKTAPVGPPPYPPMPHPPLPPGKPPPSPTPRAPPLAPPDDGSDNAPLVIGLVVLAFVLVCVAAALSVKPARLQKMRNDVAAFFRSEKTHGVGITLDSRPEADVAPRWLTVERESPRQADPRRELPPRRRAQHSPRRSPRINRI